MLAFLSRFLPEGPEPGTIDCTWLAFLVILLGAMAWEDRERIGDHLFTALRRFTEGMWRR